ncbi:MAG TPA: hypothetical protein PKI19_02905 [Elusimicrobiales bacterium]|nr:hypothetical protein [Elusimicrobiales bacterium]
MKASIFLAVIFFTAGSTAAQPAADWAGAVTKEALAAFAPPPASPAGALPRDGKNYSGAEEVLIKEFAITGIALNIPEEEVAAQTLGYPNAICFEQALRLSLKSFLEDYTDPASPLAAVLAGMGVSAEKPSKSEVKTASRKLLQLMNTPGATLALVRSSDAAQAPRGETVKANWVFRLRISGSDRAYWAVAHRAGNPVYNY